MISVSQHCYRSSTNLVRKGKGGGGGGVVNNNKIGGIFPPRNTENKANKHCNTGKQ